MSRTRAQSVIGTRAQSVIGTRAQSVIGTRVRSGSTSTLSLTLRILILLRPHWPPLRSLHSTNSQFGGLGNFCSLPEKKRFSQMTRSFFSFILSSNVRSCPPPQRLLHPSGHFTIQSQKYPQDVWTNSRGQGPDPGDGAVGSGPGRFPGRLSPCPLLTGAEVGMRGQHRPGRALTGTRLRGRPSLWGRRPCAQGGARVAKESGAPAGSLAALQAHLLPPWPPAF